MKILKLHNKSSQNTAKLATLIMLIEIPEKVLPSTQVCVEFHLPTSDAAFLRLPLHTSGENMAIVLHEHEVIFISTPF